MTHATPRPWYTHGSEINAEWTDEQGNRMNRWIATVSAGQSDVPKMEDYANAALIVHAVNTLPLLDEAKAALRGILADIEYIIEDGTLRREYVESNPSWQRAKAVLAKLEAAS